MIACFEVVYGYDIGRGTWAESDPLFMMRPTDLCQNEIDLKLCADQLTLAAGRILRLESLERFTRTQERTSQVHIQNTLKCR